MFLVGDNSSCQEPLAKVEAFTTVHDGIFLGRDIQHRNRTRLGRSGDLGKLAWVGQWRRMTAPSNRLDYIQGSLYGKWVVLSCLLHIWGFHRSHNFLVGQSLLSRLDEGLVHIHW